MDRQSVDLTLLGSIGSRLEVNDNQKYASRILDLQNVEKCATLSKIIFGFESKFGSCPSRCAL